MARHRKVSRPKVFDLQEVKEELREQKVPESMISSTTSFMRLVLPLVIREIGVKGIVEVIEGTTSETGLTERLGWAKGMAPYIVRWAKACVEKYKIAGADRDDGDREGDLGAP